MQIIVTINTCSECRYRGHSGAFTPGGAINICEHPDAPDDLYIGVRDFRDITTKEIAEKVFSLRKLNDDFSIPDFCPLKHGYEY